MRSAGASLAEWPDVMRAPGPMRLAGVLLAIGFVVAACSSESENEATQPSPPRTQLELTDVAHEVGLDFRHGAFRWSVTRDPAAMMGGGVCWLDYDEDGWLDLFAVNSYAEAETARRQEA